MKNKRFTLAVRRLADDREEESLTVYTDRFRVYDPLEDDENLQREAMIHGDGEYVDRDAHVNTYESHHRAIDAWLSPHRSVSKEKLKNPISEPSSFVGES